jgi:hypothetical protein
MIRVLLAVVLACSCSLVLADEQDAKINDIFKDFKKAEDAFADVVRGVDADALDDFDDRIKNAGKRGGVESVERWNQQKKQYIRTRAMNQDDKDARYTRMVLLAAGAVPKISKAFNALEDSHKAALKKASDANEVDVLVTLNAEWRKLLPFIDPEVKDGLQALRYYCLEANDAAEPVVQDPAPMAPQGQANNRPMNGAGVVDKINTDGVSSKCLKLFVGNEYLNKVVDRLTPRSAKTTSLSQYVYEFYKQYPPSLWTSADCDYIVERLTPYWELCTNVSMRNHIFVDHRQVWWSTTSASGSAKGWVTNHHSLTNRNLLLTYYMQWLCSAPSVDSLVQRSVHIHKKPNFTEIFSAGEKNGGYFNRWLIENGHTDPEEILAIVEKLRANNASFPAAEKLAAEIRSP